MSGLAWKLNRVRAMGVAEIVHRVGEAVGQRLQARGLGLAGRPAPQLGRLGQGRSWLPAGAPPVDRAACLAAAERILAGRFDVFAMRGLELGFPPNWNRDPKTGVEVPLRFGKGINYRDEGVVGDIKCLWEPNRHLVLTDLAQAYRLSAEPRYADAVRALLESWFEQCPYPLGPNWSSALEAALRLVSWSHTWHLLGGAGAALFQGERGQAFLARWLESVYRHCHFVAGHFSRHSSANNHLFGELTGLHVAALTWPCWPDSAGWLARTGAELEREALRQNHADGVNREQAIYYQHTVADEMLTCVLLGRANGLPRSAAFLARLEKMLEFMAALMDRGGALPMIGDADDALLANWNKQPGWCPYRSLLATGAVLFERADFKFKAGAFDEKSLWLLGEEGRARFERLAPPPAPPRFARAFPDGGYYVLGRELDTAAEVRLVADAGPLGYLGIAAHGHADALSFTLSVAGAAVLVDPGTYAYHTHKRWRDYFRGTSAHNTVRVDGLDQSESGGNFLWLRKAVARCEDWHSDAALDRLVASHDGYARLADPVAHRRKIEFCKKSATIVVEDILECRQRHELEWHWHVDPACRVTLERDAVTLAGAGFTVRLAMSGGAARPQLVRGQLEPPLGWISRRFDDKEAAPCIVWKETVVGTACRRSVFTIAMEQARPATEDKGNS